MLRAEVLIGYKDKLLEGINMAYQSPDIKQFHNERDLGARLKQMSEQKLKDMEESKRVERNYRGLQALNIPNAENAAYLPNDILGKLLGSPENLSALRTAGSGPQQGYAERQAGSYKGYQQPQEANQYQQQSQPEQPEPGPNYQQQPQRDMGDEESGFRSALARMQQQGPFNPILNKVYNPQQQIKTPQMPRAEAGLEQRRQPEPVSQPQQARAAMDEYKAMGLKPHPISPEEVDRKTQEYARRKYGNYQPKSQTEMDNIDKDIEEKRRQFEGQKTEKQLKRQAEIVESNAKDTGYLKEAKKYIDPLLVDIKKAQDLNNQFDKEGKPKLGSGALKGAESALGWLSDLESEYEGLIQDIAVKKAVALGGAVQVGKIKAEERTKAQLKLPQKAREQLLSRDQDETSWLKNRIQIYDYIVNENDGEVPLIDQKIGKIESFIADKRPPKMDPTWKENQIISKPDVPVIWKYKDGILQFQGLKGPAKNLARG